MKLVKLKPGKKPKELGTTYQNCLSFDLDNHQVILKFTEDTGNRDLHYEVVMDASEALKIASWTISQMNRVLNEK